MGFYCLSWETFPQVFISPLSSYIIPCCFIAKQKMGKKKRTNVIFSQALVPIFSLELNAAPMMEKWNAWDSILRFMNMNNSH